jgi:regulatory protein
MEPGPEHRRALSLAYDYLAGRQRSEAEMRAYLRRSGVDDATVDDAVAVLAGQKLLDDRAFAAAWTESRQSSRPRSRRLLNRELRGRGVGDEIASEATQAVDDESTAVDLARRRTHLLRGLDRGTAVRRLSDYLLRRGYDGETVRKAVRAALSGDDS